MPIEKIFFQKHFFETFLMLIRFAGLCSQVLTCHHINFKLLTNLTDKVLQITIETFLECCILLSLFFFLEFLEDHQRE